MLIHITPSYKPAYIYGGTTASVSKLCECLTNEGCDVIVLTTTANGSQELKTAPNKIRLVDGVVVMYCNRLWKDPFHLSVSLLWQLYRLSRENPTIIVHVHSWWNLTAILSVLLAKFLNLPTLLSPRGMITPYTLTNRNRILKQAFHGTIGKWLLKDVHIHATGRKEQNDILMNLKTSRIFSLPNLIHFPTNFKPIDTRCRMQCLLATPFKLLFLSRVQQKKGLEILFNALRALPFNWRLSIGGSGTDKYVTHLKSLSVKLKIADSIQWLGQVSNENKYEMLRAADVLVLPSHNENFGNVVLESLLSGTAVITSEGVGLSGYIEENNFGWVTPLNIPALTENLILAYHEAQKRNHIRQTAPDTVRRDFDPRELIREYIKFYRKIV